MLSKLFKYEFNKQLGMLGKAILIIIASVLGANLVVYLLEASKVADAGGVKMFCTILSLITTLAIYFLCFLAPIFSSTSYNNNISSDTAYLMNTLPTTGGQRVLSNFFANYLWTLISVFVGLTISFINHKSEFLNVDVLENLVRDAIKEKPLLLTFIVITVLFFIAAITMANIMVNSLTIRFTDNKVLASILAACSYLVFAGVVIISWIAGASLEMELWTIFALECVVLFIITFISYLSSARILNKHINIV